MSVTFQPGQVLTATQLNNAFTGILSFFSQNTGASNVKKSDGMTIEDAFNALPNQIQNIVLEFINPVGNADLSKLGAGILATKLPITSAIIRTQHNKNSDYVSIKDFGAIGDGVADDTQALQNALNSNQPIFVPAGTYNINQIVSVANLSVVLLGDNQYTTRFMFSTTANLTINGGDGGSEFASTHVNIDGIGFIANGFNTTNGLLNISFNAGAGGTAQHLNIVESQFIAGNATSGFQKAINLRNTRNISLDSVRILGDRGGTIAQSGYGIYLYGDTGQDGNSLAAPVEIFMKNVQCYFVNTAIGFGGWVEGVYGTNITAIACINGLVAKSGYGVRPWIVLQSSHINTEAFGVNLLDYSQCNISNNLFYTQKVNGSSNTYVGIQGVHDRESSDPWDNVIKNNTFVMAQNNISSNAIVINDITSTKYTNYLIDGNKFQYFVTAIWVQSGKNAVITDTNDFIGCGNKFIEQTAGDNYYCIAQGNTNSQKVYPDGMIDAWGSNVVTLDSNGKADVPINIGGTLLNALVTNGDYTISGSAVVGVKLDQSTSTTLKIQVAGATGGAYRVNWRVVCFRAKTYS